MTIHILIVDDHPFFREGLKSTLKKYSKGRIGEAGSLEEATNVLATNSTDICFLDINLPDGSGLKYVKRCRKEYPDIKIIMLSMHEDPIIVEEAIENGADGFLSKDASEEDIIASLETVLLGDFAFNKTIKESLSTTDTEKQKMFRSIQSLTPTERRVLKEVSESKSSKEIARSMGIHYRTVQNYRTRICSKLGISGSGALLRFAFEYKSLMDV